MGFYKLKFINLFLKYHFLNGIRFNARHICVIINIPICDIFSSVFNVNKLFWKSQFLFLSLKVTMDQCTFGTGVLAITSRGYRQQCSQDPWTQRPVYSHSSSTNLALDCSPVRPTKPLRYTRRMNQL